MALSFRFELTTAQVRTLLEIWSGTWDTPSYQETHKRNMENRASGVIYISHFVTIVDRLRSKGLVMAIPHPKSPTRTNGFRCTDRGDAIARQIIADAEEILNYKALAKKRGIA